MPVWSLLAGVDMFRKCCPLPIDWKAQSKGPGVGSIAELAIGLGVKVQDDSDPLEDI